MAKGGRLLRNPESGGYVYTYDALNRLKNIQDFQQLNYGFGYDNLSRRNSLTRPNNITTSYGYDSMSRLLSVLHKNSGGTTLDGATYTYDNAGNRLTRTDKRTNVTLSYTSYDNIYELQTVKQGATSKESYTYDLVGNRLSSLGVSPYQYNASNWLTSIPGTSYNYDNNGSLTSKSDGTTYTRRVARPSSAWAGIFSLSEETSWQSLETQRRRAAAVLKRPCRVPHTFAFVANVWALRTPAHWWLG